MVSRPSIAQRSPDYPDWHWPAEDALLEDLLEFQMAVRNPQEGLLPEAWKREFWGPLGRSPGFTRIYLDLVGGDWNMFYFSIYWE